MVRLVSASFFFSYWLWGVVLALALSGCTTQYTASISRASLQDLKLKSRYTVARVAEWRVAASTNTSMALPSDFHHAQRNRSIYSLDESLHYELRQAFPAFTHLGNVASLSDAFSAAEQQGSQLLFLPQLIDVENNLNSREELMEGKGLHQGKKRAPDKIVFRVLIYDVRTRQLLDNARVVGHGRMFSPSHLEPRELYARAAERYVSSISALAQL